MQITTNKFIQALSQSNISLELKKKIINNLENLSFEQFQEIYQILLKNIEEQKEIITKFRQKNKMLDLEFEMKLKSEMKKLKSS